jgi:hypothetical protein
MTTRDDARRTAGEPRQEGLRLVPPRPDPGSFDPDRDEDRGPGRDADRASATPTRPSSLSERLYAARERKGVDL